MSSTCTALAGFTAVFVPDESGRATGRHDDSSLQSQTRMLLELASLPNATGEQSILPHFIDDIGRQQQQKQIRRVVRQYLPSTIIGLWAWRGLAATSRSLSTKILAANGEEKRPSLDSGGQTTSIYGLDEVRTCGARLRA